MNNYEELISQKLSKIIKQKRIKQKLSQKELAEGICSQGMISSIEHGDYIPNTAIFLAICDLNNHINGLIRSLKQLLNWIFDWPSS